MNSEERQPVLNQFSQADQVIIRQRQQVLSSLAHFIGKDFRIPVVVGLPSEDNPSGWRWQQNKDGSQFIQMNAYDLLEKPIDYLRFVTSHEGGHRRISRPAEVIPEEVWKQPGFSLLWNAIEDPRDNNFVGEVYPRFKQQMRLAYEMHEETEQQAKEEALIDLGQVPRFKQAGFEFIKLWFRESQGQDAQLSEDLPDDVREVVQNTLASARDAWLRYPSRKEADESENLIQAYAKVSYEIIRDEIWPEFQKLVDSDVEDQLIRQAVGQDGLPADLKSALDEEMGQPSGSMDSRSVSPELTQKIKDYIESLPEEQKKALKDKARKIIEDFANKIAGELQGKLIENPVQKKQREDEEDSVGQNEKTVSVGTQAELTDATKPTTKIDDSKLEAIRNKIDQILNEDKNVYEQCRREMLPIIDELERDLREIFVKRTTQKWLTGFKTGKRISIKRRIQEKAKEVSAFQSKAWEKREQPDKKDYAISLLVDLTGSMQTGNKIQETFKGIVVLAEVLNRLSIQTEIIGFTNSLYEYQTYGQQMSDEMRGKMGGMFDVVNRPPPGAHTDLGWATATASARLAKQPMKEKFLIVLTDGQPAESMLHPRSEYELGSIVKGIGNNTDQKLIGLGIGHGTEFVENYFPNSLVVPEVGEMAQQLSGLLREVIVDYGSF